MADVTQGEVKPNGGWTGGTPSALLSSDSLPQNPKRVVRTYASDLAALKGAPPPPPPTEAPMAAASAPLPRPAPFVPQPAPMRIPPPVQPAARPRQSLSDAVSNIRLPQEPSDEEVPRMPPLPQRPPEPMYVQKLESAPPPRPAPAPRPRREPAPSTVFTEGVVHEKTPSAMEQLFDFLFGKKNDHSDEIPLLPSITPVPRVVQEAQTAAPPEYISTGTQEAPIGSAVPSLAAAEELRNREEVLARLRSRVATYQGENNAPPPVFPSPKPEAPSGYRPPAPPPLPRNLPGAGFEESDRFHTFASDFSNQTEREGASAFSVLAAQADAPRPAPAPAPQSRRGLAYALIATVLFVGGSTLLYLGYSYLAANSPVSPLAAGPATRVTGDDTTTLTYSSSAALMQDLAAAENVSIPVGNIRVAYVSISSTTPKGVVTNTYPGGVLVAGLQLPAPSILLRNIGEDSTVGIVHAGDDTRAFFVLDASSYDRTFAGMYAWEPTIGSDLAPLFPAYPATEPVGTTTASSTPVTPTAPRFMDEVVESHDVRALKDSQGRTILLYGFRDQETLIIARDETAFSVLLARLSATQ